MAQNEVRFDFLATDDSALLIQNGDFVINEAIHQQAQTILTVAAGEIRYEPLLGAAFSRFLGTNLDDATLSTIAASELEKDGILLHSLDITRDRNNVTFDIKLK